jgi:hypothetical protein
MADEGGPYEDGDSPPARHGGDFYDAHADRDNGDNRKREVLYYWLALSPCAFTISTALLFSSVGEAVVSLVSMSVCL